MPIQLANAADRALALSALYRLASEALAYPMASNVARLRNEDLPFALAVAGNLSESLRRSVEDVATAFRGVRRAQLEERFRGAFSHVHSADCPPFETDLTTKDVFRQSRDLADLAGFYRAFGLEGSDEERERPDHVSVELEFLHVLSYKEAWAAAGGDEAGARICRETRKAFLRDHSLRWMPEFARRLEAVATGPYAAVARLVAGLCQDEAASFGLSLDGPDPEPGVRPPMLEDAPAGCEERT